MKRVLKELVISRIAAVDRPCQEGATATILKRDFSEDQRKALADKGQAMPDGSFPIATKQDLKNAVQAHGRASNPEAAKKHIIARAKVMGASDMLPDDWVSKSALVSEQLSKLSTGVEALVEQRREELRKRLLMAQIRVLKVRANDMLGGKKDKGPRMAGKGPVPRDALATFGK